MRKSAFFSQRSLLTFMALTGLVNAYLMRLCLNMAILKMSDQKTLNSRALHDNDTQIYLKHTQSTMMDGTAIVNSFAAADPKEWSEDTKGLCKSSFFIGYALLHVPGSFLGQKYGGKTILSIGLFLTALCSLLTPLAVEHTGSVGLIVLRFFMGIGEAPAYPALIYLLSCWIPAEERGRVSSIVFSGGQIGSIICNLITGYVLKYIDGYSPIFYIFGAVGLLWNITFQFLVYNTPATHPRISTEEKEYLRNKVGDLLQTKNFCQIPWTSMLTSPAVLSLIIAQMGHDWGFYILATEMPNYLRVIIKMDYQEMAWYASLPFLVASLFSLLCGFVCDHIVKRRLVTLTRARQIFTAIAALATAAFTIMIYYVELNRTAVVVCFTLAMGSMGGYYTGAKANFLDLCPNYAGALMGLVNGTGAVCGFLVPYLTGLLTAKQDRLEWEPVFWTSFVILTATLLTYMVWGSAEVQSWNDNIDEDDCLKESYRRLFRRKVEKVESEDKLNEIVGVDVVNEKKS